MADVSAHQVRPLHVSAVIACAGDDEAEATIAALPQLQSALAANFSDSEIIVVVCGVSDAASLALVAAVDRTPDLSAHFLAHGVDHNVARLIGMEIAIGDWLLLLTPSRAEIDAIPAMFAAAAEGFDSVVARGGGGVRPGLYALLERGYNQLYRTLHGVRITSEVQVLRILSRAAGLYLVNSPAGEMLLKSAELAPGFPARAIDLPVLPAPRAQPRTIGEALSKGTSLLMTTGISPLRYVTVAALLAGVLGFFYSLYVVAIYLFKDDVQPGWTTLSLQVSAFMVLFSLMFAMLAEYVVQLHAASRPRRRAAVVRELRSPITRRGTRLNVVDDAGQFRVGAPPSVPNVMPPTAATPT